VTAVTKRNAFEEMMKTAGKGKASSKTPSSSQTSTTTKQPTKVTTSTSSRAKEKTIDVDDDEFDDGWLEELPAGDLDIIEKRAKVDLNTPKADLPKPGTLAHALTTRHQPTSGAAKLNINVAPRRPIPTKPSAPSFKTKFMQEMRKEHRIGQAERARAPVGGGIAKLSGASAIGSGLGAYTGPPRSIKRMEDSGSSASESSDEDNSGLKEMAKRQKSPVKRFTIEPAARGIKVIGNAMDDVMRQREERRNAQHRTKQRLRPDISDLHRFVLSWDPQHIGPTPPHHAQYAAQTSKLGPVPSTFPSAKQYEQVMLPLFLQELWAQSQQEKPSDAPMVVEVASRQYDDGFVDIDVFSKQMYASFVNDSDIVILSQPGQSGRTVLAKVQAFKKKQNVATIKLRVSTLMDRNLVVPKTTWHMTKHFS
jgi:senataxin